MEEDDILDPQLLPSIPIQSELPTKPRFSLRSLIPSGEQSSSDNDSDMDYEPRPSEHSGSTSDLFASPPRLNPPRLLCHWQRYHWLWQREREALQ